MFRKAKQRVLLCKTSGLATGTYEYGLQRLSVEHVNEAKEYYLYNGTGNVVQTTAENGSAFLRYTYDPFGNVTSINAPMTVDIDDLNRYTYNGEDYDYNTGLQYLRARYYNTGTGSFISQDTYLGNLLNPLSQNRCTYCHNSPVMFDDPSGHFLNVLIGAVAGATIGVIGEIGSSLISGEKINWTKVRISAATGAASGALMSVGLPVGVVALGNAAIDMAGNVAEQRAEIKSGERTKFSYGEMIFEGAVSAFSSLRFYKPSVPKHMISEENRMMKQIFKNGKQAWKAMKYTWSQIKDDVFSLCAKQFAPKEIAQEIADNYLYGKIKDSLFSSEKEECNA